MIWDALSDGRITPEQVPVYERADAALRRTLDAWSAARFDETTYVEVTERLDALAATLEKLGGPETEQICGRIPTLPVGGQTLVPPFHITHEGPDRVEGTVRLGRWYMGAGMAAHGGTIPLLFDDVLGMLALRVSGKHTRTAYLTTNYRSISPTNAEFRVTAWIERHEGRKWFVRGELHHGDVLCADIDSLFVELKPGQP